ncbi:helix-turn-helix domain-containing protein [Terrihalobacillus insolitus]|uniref:helix-turn-helix domain-containing protein n=1 Tax=Terrihalobacillus insolitus TaxID=2950438 RepID=UPI002341E71C|nr:helix-turn-helix domain-containing protein [Terrihalobacillus insolitus]MDC3414408.1 helix-turn-helix domain-containing protein [Terrihalobacillus insolitus]
MKNNLIATSIFSLAIAIVIGSWFISSGLNNNGERILIEKNDMETTHETLLLTQSELGDYLGITEEEIQMFISEDIIKSGIPYIKIGNEFYFSVKAIDKWLVEVGTLKVGQ